MRIGIFSDQYYPNVSGVVTSIKMLYEGLTALGHECFIFTSYDETKVIDNAEIESKNIINIYGRPYPFKGLKDYRYTFTHKKFLKYVKNVNLDIIHVHTEYNISKLAKLAHKKLKIPMVHTLHTLYTDYFKYVSPIFDKHFRGFLACAMRKLFIRPISKRSIIETVPTMKVYDQRKKYGMGNDIRIVPTGIEIEKFNPKNFSKGQISELKKSLGLKENQFVFLYVGRISKEKSISMIINAYAKACKENENTVLLIVGGGPELEDLKKLAKKNGIENQVIFTDAIPWKDIQIYYQLGDIFVNASISETQGLTYLESLASKLPLLVQKDECIANVIENYYNGIYFDGENDLVLKMTEILKAPETLKKIKANTLSSVADYNKQKYAEAMLSIYEEAIDKYKALNS